jgi:hypothetical protein
MQVKYLPTRPHDSIVVGKRIGFQKGEATEANNVPLVTESEEKQ